MKANTHGVARHLFSRHLSGSVRHKRKVSGKPLPLMYTSQHGFFPTGGSTPSIRYLATNPSWIEHHTFHQIDSSVGSVCALVTFWTVFWRIWKSHIQMGILSGCLRQLPLKTIHVVWTNKSWHRRSNTVEAKWCDCCLSAFQYKLTHQQTSDQSNNGFILWEWWKVCPGSCAKKGRAIRGREVNFQNFRRMTRQPVWTFTHSWFSL